MRLASFVSNDENNNGKDAGARTHPMRRNNSSSGGGGGSFGKPFKNGSGGGMPMPIPQENFHPYQIDKKAG